MACAMRLNPSGSNKYATLPEKHGVPGNGRALARAAMSRMRPAELDPTTTLLMSYRLRLRSTAYNASARTS